MPVNAYIGDPRSGKTYEVATVVIFNAIKQGRRALSNIAGLNQEEFYRLIKLENPDAENLGQIISVSHDEVSKPDFWLTDGDANTVRHDRQIQRGDVVVLDEIWRFWSGFSLVDTSKEKTDPLYKRPTSVMNFFRMHGHMPHPVSGYICEISLITQDLGDIHRSVKSIINQTFKTSKLTALGLSKRYRLDVYNKTKTNKPISTYQRTYDDKYFSLYKSHSMQEEGGAQPVEKTIDRRGNVLKSKIFPILLFLLVLAFFSVRYLFSFFHPLAAKPATVSSPSGTPSAPAQMVPSQSIQPPAQSSDFRIVGKVKKKGVEYFVIQSVAGQFRYVAAPSIKDYGIDKQIIFDGVIANSWERFNANNNSSFPVPAH